VACWTGGLGVFGRLPPPQRLAEDLLKVAMKQFADAVVRNKSLLNGAPSAVGPRNASLQQPQRRVTH